MEVRYYRCLPLSLFKWRTTMFKKYKPDLCQPDWGDIQTGLMSVEHFLVLKEDIRKNGCVNPVIAEYDNQWVIRTGNNRAEAMTQLGTSHVDAILIAKAEGPWPKGPWPEGGELIETHKLREFLAQIWTEITAGDGRPYNRQAWHDCKILVETML